MVGVEEGIMNTDLLFDLVIRYGFQVLGALVILGVGAMIAGWLGRVADRRLQARTMEPPLRMLAVRVLRLVVMLFAVVVALDKFGFQIAPLVAGIGVVGLGIGIALQGVIGNLVAGLSIILTKPFRVGEFIQVVGVQGEVSAIELFSTTLRHSDRSRIVIPNGKLVGEILHNFGTMRQLNLSVTVPHGTDISAALATARRHRAAQPARAEGSLAGDRRGPGPRRRRQARHRALGAGAGRRPGRQRAVPGAARAVRHAQHPLGNRADRRAAAERRTDRVSPGRGWRLPLD